MPFISGTIPALINGVSQQPQTTRNPSQATEQINMLSTPAKGLRRRPGLQVIAVPGVGLPVSNPDDYAAHAYRRTDDEQYHILIYGVTGEVRITNLADGVVSSLTNPYFVTTNARRFLKFLTVGDFTFVANTERIVTPSAEATSPLINPTQNTTPNLSDLYITVRIGNYGKTYSATINLVGGGQLTASKTTANGGSPSDVTDISTDNIAEALRSGLQADINAQGLTGVFVQRYGSTLHVYTVGTAPLGNRVKSFVLRDGFAGQALEGFNQIIDDFSKLPSQASPDSAPIKVVEGASRDNLGYYVRFESDAVGGTGSWRECESLYQAEDGGHKLPTPTTERLAAGFDPLTMPRTIVSLGPNVFEVQVPEWGTRKAGDASSAKDPSFVGRTINGMFFHRNRLGFISDDGVSMSEADNFFNFYPTTVIQVVDTDRIDVQANTTVVDDFHSATAFDKDLFVFGRRTQYRLSGEPLLTPKTVEMKLVTSYDCNEDIQPLTVGARIYFANRRGVFTSMREMYLTDTSVLDAPLITAQAPEYVPADIRFMTASTSDDLIAICPTEADAMFIYAFYFQGQEKLMGGWSRWEFKRPDGSFVHPIHAQFLNSELIVTHITSEAVSVSLMDVSLSDRGDHGEYGYSVMDFSIDYLSEVMELDGLGNTTVDAVGLTIGDNVVACIIDPVAPEAGQQIEVSYDANTQKYILPGDYTGYQAVRIGLKTVSEYTMSEFYARRNNGQGGTITDTLTRLAVRRVEVVYENGTNFRAEVTPEKRQTYVTPMPKATEVTYASYAGQYAYPQKDGIFRFSVNTKNVGTTIKLVSDSIHPVDFLSATWEAQASRNSRPT